MFGSPRDSITQSAINHRKKHTTKKKKQNKKNKTKKKRVNKTKSLHFYIAQYNQC